MPSQKVLTLLSSLILIGLTSCGGRVSQCKQLVTPINNADSFVQEYEQDMDKALAQFSSAENLSDMNAAASSYVRVVNNVLGQLNALVQETSAVNIEDEQLNEYREQYVVSITQWTTALTTARDSMAELASVATEAEVPSMFGRFQAKADSAFSAIQTIDTQEAELIETIVAYCESNAEQ